MTFSNDSRKFLPLVFTEQGVAMLSSILRSEKAIQINVLNNLIEKQRETNQIGFKAENK